MQAVTIIYKLSVTNLKFTLGLTENKDVDGNKINDFFMFPQCGAVMGKSLHIKIQYDSTFRVV